MVGVKLSEQQIVRELQEIKMILQKQTDNVYKILLLTIGGAFALIGIKLVLPT